MTRRKERTFRLAASLVLVFACSSASAQTATRIGEYPFAVGAGGFFVNDTGRSADVGAFSTGGFHAFFELALDPGVSLQLRYESFQLPGTSYYPPFGQAVAGPRIKVDAGNASVAYVFRETWWDAGLFAGVGVYHLAPRPPEYGQTALDVSESVVGWNFGTLVVFRLVRRWDLRIEAAGYILGSDPSKKLIQLGGSLAYHF